MYRVCKAHEQLTGLVDGGAAAAAAALAQVWPHVMLVRMTDGTQSLMTQLVRSQYPHHAADVYVYPAVRCRLRSYPEGFAFDCFACGNILPTSHPGHIRNSEPQCYARTQAYHLGNGFVRFV